MAEQQAIAFAWNDAQIGRQLDVLIDSPVPGEPNAWIGRSYADAPDVDGVVYVTGTGVTGTGVTGTGGTGTGGTGVGISPGALVPCELVARREYDLMGVACGEPL
jgi:ribosomal protein S12 methylthiotransferase